MFKSHRSAKPPPAVRIESLLGPDTEIQGNLTCRGSVRLDGRLEGNLHADHVTIGEGAVVQGDIFAKSVVVGGKVLGNVAADGIEIKTRAQIFGDIKTRHLSIAEGATFEGKCSMSKEPISAFAFSSLKASGPEGPVFFTPSRS